MKRKNYIGVLAAVGILVLILDAKTALSGASDGVSLCIRSVIPSLFPFLALSALVTAAFRDLRIGWLGKPLGIPAGADGLLAVSILGGYPAGAASVGQLFKSGLLSRQTARRLLMFCSNAGPAFIFGIVAAQFSDPWAPWALWGIQILSSLAVGLLVPGKVRETASDATAKTDALNQAISAMAEICGWVVLFRTALSVMDRHILRYFPQTLVVLVHGLCELTCGCLELTAIDDEGLRFLTAAALLNFGGLCVLLQTRSVTRGLGIGSYLKGKLLQTAISLVLAWIVLTRQVWGIALLVLVAIFLRETQKRGSNPSAVGV